jgi:hypothetical protein
MTIPRFWLLSDTIHSRLQYLIRFTSRGIILMDRWVSRRWAAGRFTVVAV